MKTKKYVNGRVVTTFGYYLHVVLVVLGFASFMLALGFTGGCELGEITLREYVVRVIPCMTVMGSCVLIHQKLF
ncbi:MAG: hypothetical protein IKW20_06270 [Bacteroidales bacterium]|nr:hypothetical protein [Bacteroidales bacterium]